MLNLSQRIEAFATLGSFLRAELSSENSDWLRDVTAKAKLKNGWFEPREVEFALKSWSDILTLENLQDWTKQELSTEPSTPTDVGLVLAGNIPMVGFHDILTTIISGNRALIKLSSNDDVIIPALLSKLKELNSAMGEYFLVVNRLEEFQAVIATGSNNSARYFEQYFGKVPHIIRKNRTSAAILNGSETEEELSALMKDCFQYFGLGCRNVTKLFLPIDYDLNKIFSASLPFAYLMDNKKYVNNYTYHKALMMMEKKEVLENELILLTENPSLFSPVSVLNYEYYRSEADLREMIEPNFDQLQCIIGHNQLPFGSAQSPNLSDYADGVNTLNFLQNLEPARLPN